MDYYIHGVRKYYLKGYRTTIWTIIYHYFLETYEKFAKNVENSKIFNKVRAYIRQTKRF